MADEPQAATAETEAPPQAELVDAAAPPSEPTEPIDWDALDASLERAYERDPKTASDRLKKHRAIGGIAGSIAEGRFEKMQRDREATDQAKAAENARAELRKMAQDKPLEFADMFLSHDDAEQAKARIFSVEQNAAKAIMEQIGEAYHGLPEWTDLTDVEKTKLREAVEGNQANPLPSFNRVALDIVADRRSEKKAGDRLAKEKEAWKKEWEAERLTSEQGPDLRKATSGSSRRVDWAAMDDKDFDAWWKKQYG